MIVFFRIVLCAFAFFFLSKGGDYFVTGATGLSKKTRIPTAIIGATVVSIGTTLPEITVSVLSAAGGDLALAESNALGSIFCNIALILGIVFTLSKGRIIQGVKDKLIYLTAVTILLLIFILTNGLALWEGIVLLILFVGFIFLNIVSAKKAPLQKEDLKQEEHSIFQLILYFFVGIIAVVGGSELLVENVKVLAALAGIPTSVIGFTVVALGTSLPELFTGISAVKQNQLELTVGNIAGANIINGSFLLGVSRLVGACESEEIFTNAISGIFVLIATAILVIPIFTKGKCNRIQGILLLIVYIAYLVWLMLYTFL